MNKRDEGGVEVSAERLRVGLQREGILPGVVAEVIEGSCRRPAGGRHQQIEPCAAILGVRQLCCRLTPEHLWSRISREQSAQRAKRKQSFRTPKGAPM